ncbi:MAG TPA: DNA-3-methyladenine glycosylase [Phycisphaerales bacterium]|nr:DNA-3-methyladenine glycosylase [Phycisphaerales bacterium]
MPKAGTSTARSEPQPLPPRSALPRRFFAADPEILARKLLGCTLVRILADGTRLGGVIVETEAYLGAIDRAAHTFGGRRTARNESMWGHPGIAYVYFTYGMHWCMNISAGALGDPVAVLLRALRPTEGLERMRELRAAGGRRKTPLADTELCAGPARLCQALAIDRSLDGLDLTAAGSPLFVERRKQDRVSDDQVARGARIGIAYAGDWAARPLRFAVRGSPFVSRPRL